MLFLQNSMATKFTRAKHRLFVPFVFLNSFWPLLMLGHLKNVLKGNDASVTRETQVHVLILHTCIQLSMLSSYQWSTAGRHTCESGMSTSNTGRWASAKGISLFSNNHQSKLIPLLHSHNTNPQTIIKVRRIFRLHEMCIGRFPALLCDGQLWEENSGKLDVHNGWL